MQATYNQQQIERTRYIAKIIGDANTILILYELMNFGEKSFNELKRMTGINAVTLSKKLHMLKAERLVDCTEHGQERHYFVTETTVTLRPLIKDIEKIVLTHKED